MARPSIPEEQYEQAISQMIADGTPLDYITATKLQAIVGGRYSRAAELLKAYQEAHTNTQQADVPEKPEWFDGFQQALISQTDKLWSEIVSPEIQRRYDLAAKEAEKARHESELNRADDLKHITALEDNNEQQAEANDQLCKEISNLKLQLASEQAKREQASEQHQKEIEQCQQQIAQLRAEVESRSQRSAELEASNQQYKNRIEQLKDELAISKQSQEEAARELAANQQENSRLSGRLGMYQEEKQHLQDELAKVNQVLNDERHKSAQAQAISEQQEKRITELNGQIATLDQRQQETAEKLSVSQQQSSKLSGQLEVAQENQKQIQAQLTRLGEELQSERRKCAQLEAVSQQANKQ